MERRRATATVLTADLCADYGCEECPGVGQYDPATMQADNPIAKAGEPVFCIHHCHEKSVTA